MSEFIMQPAQLSAIIQERTPLCPARGCNGTMEIDYVTGKMSGTGLQGLRCRVCKHQGFRTLEGIHVLFGTRHEHVCSYGPSAQSLTLVFSGTALALFRDGGLSPTQSALYAAHWALLSGQLDGTVRLFPESLTLLHCYAHFHREILGKSPYNHTETLSPLGYPLSSDVTVVGRDIEDECSLRHGGSEHQC